MGEYVRSLNIATQLAAENYEIHFALNSSAPYCSSCPFPVSQLPASPTKCTAEVLDLLRHLKPDLVVYDASGRAKQLAYCAKNNIKTVFIAQHRQKLAKALRLTRLLNTDLILVAQSQALTGPLTWIQKIKLALLNKSHPVYLGPIYLEASIEDQKSFLENTALSPGQYVLFNAGGGGNKINIDGEVRSATENYIQLAKKLADHINSSGDSCTKCVVVGGANYLDASKINLDGIHYIDSCKATEFHTLLTNCKFAVLSGGSSLLQAIASGVGSIVALPLATDQKKRIERCRDLFGITSCEIDEEKILICLFDKLKGDKLKDSRKKIKNTLENGLHRSVIEIKKLLAK